MKALLGNTLFIMVFILTLIIFIFVFNEFLFKQKNISFTASAQNEEKNISTNEKLLFKYVEITDGCDWEFKEGCVNVRSGPGKEYKIVARLRNGIVLKVDKIETINGENWYKISFDEWLRYPERLNNDWYISDEVVDLFLDEGVVELNKTNNIITTKRIVVDISEQMLYAYDGMLLFMKEPVSTGLELSLTPVGKFTIYRKNPSRYMQGPIPDVSEHDYDLPGVPWNLYFSKSGAVIHGAYWHNNFGNKMSSGCVNMLPEKAKILYKWVDVGTPVTVQN